MQDTPRFKEREFVILIALASLYAWGSVTGGLEPSDLEAVKIMLVAAIPGFQISRGLKKSAATTKVEEEVEP